MLLLTLRHFVVVREGLVHGSDPVRAESVRVQLGRAAEASTAGRSRSNQTGEVPGGPGVPGQDHEANAQGDFIVKKIIPIIFSFAGPARADPSRVRVRPTLEANRNQEGEGTLLKMIKRMFPRPRMMRAEFHTSSYNQEDTFEL